MKAEKNDISLEELFRRRLENSYIIPDRSVSSKLMRKLAIKEFLAFHPSRFNIYYLGCLIAAAVTAFLILSSGSVSRPVSFREGIINQLPGNTTPETITSPSESGLTERKGITERRDMLQEGLNTVKPGETFAGNEPDKEIYGMERYKFSPKAADRHLKGKRLFIQSSPGSIKLQKSQDSGGLPFEVSVVEGCAPLKVYFENKLTDYDSCQWIFGEGGSANTRNAEWTFDGDGQHEVILKVFLSNGLQRTSSVVITVFPEPTARFEIASEKDALSDNEIRFRNYSADAVRFYWNFGDGNFSEQFEPSHLYSKRGYYNVTLYAYSEYGYADSLKIFNIHSGPEYYIKFPNAFIQHPGGPSGGYFSRTSDENAEVFHPSGSGVSVYKLKIFSKTGILMFESCDINLGWDGYFNGQLCSPGVYIWKVTGNFRNGEQFIKMGDITLLRK